MSTEEDSGIGGSPLKRKKLRVTINSDSESEPIPGCSNWKDEHKTYSREVVKKTPYKRLRFQESDTDSEEEVRHEPTSVRRKPRRSLRLRNASHESDKSSEDEEKEARRSQRNRMSAEKEKRFRSLERLSARRAGKKIPEESDDDEQGSTNAENSDSDTPTIHDDSSEISSSEEETYRGYEVATRTFVSRYQGLCKLPSCSNRFVVDETKVIGVYFDHDLNQEKPAWICAKHEYIDYEEEAEKNAILDDLERTQSDEEFIDDPDEGDLEDDNSSSDIDDAMDEIKQSLRKETPKDIENANQYMSQHGKYQLQIRSRENKSLYTCPEARYRRNMRSAKFDVGMKDGSERYDSELENKLLCTSKKKRKKKKK